MDKRQLKVFLCHSSGDKPAVRDLYNRLRSLTDYVCPWLDEEDLLPGQRWEEEIPKAVRASDVVIVCLSQGSINKRGFVQKEIKYALDAADEQPEGTIFLIPVRLEDCALPDRLKHFHTVNLYNSRGFERLLRALETRAENLGFIKIPEPAERQVENKVLASLFRIRDNTSFLWLGLVSHVEDRSAFTVLIKSTTVDKIRSDLEFLKSAGKLNYSLTKQTFDIISGELIYEISVTDTTSAFWESVRRVNEIDRA